MKGNHDSYVERGERGHVIDALRHRVFNYKAACLGVNVLYAESSLDFVYV